ncbi:hypothetical protein PRIPAC_80633 [Pristionchus pacificus]|uniref:Uncharacterized protein n=1 Tax=Pristionchus pacificus TaxID=54126 RepID=A0A2A6BEE1_PRIPA|nr:hypothetical protein PRIPAC_80633 [Pristionchus pacificus]|eukprot:PDM64275.1 hypothetical protein PRIPAC_53650 [Pristionchus pacificus]
MKAPKRSFNIPSSTSVSARTRETTRDSRCADQCVRRPLLSLPEERRSEQELRREEHGQGRVAAHRLLEWEGENAMNYTGKSTDRAESPATDCWNGEKDVLLKIPKKMRADSERGLFQQIGLVHVEVVALWRLRSETRTWQEQLEVDRLQQRETVLDDVDVAVDHRAECTALAEPHTSHAVCEC